MKILTASKEVATATPTHGIVQPAKPQATAELHHAKGLTPAGQPANPAVAKAERVACRLLPGASRVAATLVDQSHTVGR
jgi:hypothetical protein